MPAQPLAASARRGPGGRPRGPPARLRRSSAIVASSSPARPVPPPRVRDDAHARRPRATAAMVSMSGAAYLSTYAGSPGLEVRSNASARSATAPWRTSASATCGRPVAMASPETASRSSAVIAIPRPQQPGEHRRHPASCVPRRIRSSSLASGGVRRVGQVGEQVHARATVAGADLHAADQLDADVVRRRRRLVPAGGGVVVGDGDDVEPGLGGRAHQLGRRLGAVAGAGVGVEVDAHRSWRVTSPGRPRPAEGHLDQLRADPGDVAQDPVVAQQQHRRGRAQHQPQPAPVGLAGEDRAVELGVDAGSSRPPRAAPAGCRSAPAPAAGRRRSRRPASRASSPARRAPRPTPASSATTNTSTGPSSSLVPEQHVRVATGPPLARRRDDREVGHAPARTHRPREVGRELRRRARCSANSS